MPMVERLYTYKNGRERKQMAGKSRKDVEDRMKKCGLDVDEWELVEVLPNKSIDRL